MLRSGSPLLIAEYRLCETMGSTSTSCQRTPVGAFRGKAMELLDISDDEDNRLLIFKAFSLGENFLKTITQAIYSPMLASAEALKDFFDDSNTCRTNLEDYYFMPSGSWNSELHKEWSEKKVIGEAFSVPDLNEGSQSTSLINKKTEGHSPFLWRVMKSGNYQYFLQKEDVLLRAHWGSTTS